MKSLINILFPVALLVILAGCTKKKEIAEEASVAITFDNVVDEDPLENGGPLTNPNAAGNNYNTTSFKYIISNIVLIDQAGAEVKFNNYDIIDGFGGNQTAGIENVLKKYPELNLWIADIDEELTAKGYIVPGLGDAGDLAYGSKMQF